MYKSEIKIRARNGIHLRIAAEIVHKAEWIKGKYGVNLYIKNPMANEPIAISMLALLSLRIRENDIIEICCREENEIGIKAVNELLQLIETVDDTENDNFSKIDDIMDEGTIANEQIIESLPVGIIVIDINSSVTMVNAYGLKLIGMKSENVLGKYVKNILPTSELPGILKSKEHNIGKIQHINGHIVMVNRSPIFSPAGIIGAIGIFQDISEMVGMKELNEKFQRILEASHDIICFIDENRKVSYINPAYESSFNVKSKDIVGKDIMELSPDGLRMKVFNTKVKIENMVCERDNVDIVATIEPIFIDGSFKGVISICKPVNEIKDMMKKLEESEEEINYYRDELKRQTYRNGTFGDIIGASDSLRDCIVIAEKASKTTSTVLIRGESGTGKELIAKAIHSSSDRKNRPFVRVNCAAIPENLLESELFGYEKGAFTGAVKSKPGKFNVANGGTIFLDEIGDIPKSMQVKLLRVLQEKEFESVGGIVTQKVDVRIIAATNRNLEEMLSTGEFREDLYYRLNVITIALPPLRNRKEDICILAEHFIRKISQKLQKEVDGIDKECIMYFQGYNWPGNIRELENVIERAINLCDRKIITTDDLPSYITNDSSSHLGFLNLKDDELHTMEEYEREIIKAAMEKYKSYNKAGKALGLTHRTISLKCKKYGIGN